MFDEYSLAVVTAGRASFTKADAAKIRADLLSEQRPATLKNADDQSVAGLLAIRQALSRRHMPPEHMREWGVLAAPRAPGRAFMANVMQRFADEGAWGVSPHIIPNCSLHSVAGSLSVAFDLRGPNLGVGGAPGREGELWMVASTWLSDGSVPGIWLVMTGWNDATCLAVAIAVCRQGEATLANIQLIASGSQAAGRVPDFSLESLDRILSLGNHVPLRSRWSIPGGFALEWRNHMADKGRIAA